MSARLLLAVVGSLAVAGSVAAQTQTLKTEAKLSPDGSDVLAEGPFVGTIESVNGGVGNVPPVKHKDVIVRFVTRKAVYFQEKEGPLYDPRSLSAETTKFLRVSATVGGPDKRKGVRVWQASADGGGPRELSDADPKAAPVVAFRPDPVGAAAPSRRELAHFQYHAVARLQQRADTALLAGDDRLCDGFVKRAEEMAGVARTGAGDAAVGRLYATLPGYLRDQQKAFARTRELVAEQQKDDKEFFARKQAAYARRSQQMMGGMLAGFVGALANSSTTYVKWSDGSVTTESNPDIAGGLATFLNTAAGAEAEFAGQMQSIESAQAALTKERADEFGRLAKEVAARRAERAEAVRKVGADDFKIAARNDRGAAEPRKGRATLDALKSRAERDKGNVGRDNPYALADLYQEQALAVSPKDDPAAGRKVFDLAERVAEAAKLVPPSKEYHFDRLELLRTAAALACLAATYETRTQSWANLYSPRGAYAVRLLDAVPLADVDVTGEARQQRAVALLLLGQRAVALHQLEDVEPLRNTAADFQLLRARLLALNALTKDEKTEPGKTDRRRMLGEGGDALEAAMRCGFCQLKVLENPDFLTLRGGIHADRFKALVRPDAACSISLSGDAAVVSVKNTSKFPLQNVRVEITAQVLDGRKVVTRQFHNDKEPIPSIPPGGSYPLEMPIPFDRSQFRGVKVSIQSDQGKIPKPAVTVPR